MRSWPKLPNVNLSARTATRYEPSSARDGTHGQVHMSRSRGAAVRRSANGRVVMAEASPHQPAANTVNVQDVRGENLFRLCAMCGLWKPQSDFHESRTGQFSYCRECRRAYDRRYYHERGKQSRLARRRLSAKAARAWMASIKEGVPCADCGQVFPVWVMHWDHLPGYEKVGSISTLVTSRRRTLILAELKKCELVCANCHVLRTISRAGCSSAW